MQSEEKARFRREMKHEITYADMFSLRPRLAAVMEHDRHAVDGQYKIRSLYFDNLQDKVYQESLCGISRREKFRLRYYNGDPSFILLEKKSKADGFCFKEQERLSVGETNAILDGSLAESEKPLVSELLYKMNTQGLRPKTIVDYTREPFVYDAGSVRVTLDYNIRTGIYSTDFLNDDCITVPVLDHPIILEVKWTEFLPSVIRDIVQTGCRASAFSKYSSCRVFG